MTGVPALTAGDVFRTQRQALRLDWVAGRGGRDRRLEPGDARHPGMALVGYLNFIHPNRVQVLGEGELGYLESLPPPERRQRLEALFSDPGTAMVVVADGAPAPADMRAQAETRRAPLYVSTLAGPRLIHALQYYLRLALAERTTLHGVFLQVMGMGVLLTGESGIGKSEVALELLSRNHRLIADDAVEVYRVGPGLLHGRCPDTLRDFLEVRGLGILNIRAMYGETAIAREARLDLIVRFEQLSPRQVNQLDRLQSEKKTRRILEVDTPEVTLLVAPGRDLAVLVEVAARHHILHLRGISPLREFIARQETVMEHNRVARESGRDDDDRGNGGDK